MSNSNTQLDLFHGVILTPVQEKIISDYIIQQEKNVIKRQTECNDILRLLEEAGFENGKDFETTFKMEEWSGKREFGYSYNNTNFDYEVTYMGCSGGVDIIYNVLHEGKIKKSRCNVSIENGKLQAYSITPQYRYYKASSLLAKLKEKNESVVSNLEHKGKQEIATAIIVAKYKKLYPEAVVYVSTDYYRRSYRSFPIVKVKFTSGSEVSFSLGYGDEMEKERFHKKWDAVSESTEALMERFNNQKAK
tara:strand:+ start:181 stop:924 length:744 start_codon:yes stop_codon:yes gene_type:complete